MSPLLEFRRSQGIVPFGVGAIVDFPEESLMAAGLDLWPSEQAGVDSHSRARILDATTIIDGRLQARLSIGRRPPIRRFLTPVEARPKRRVIGAPASESGVYYGSMPFVRFPEWHFCARCHAMWQVPWNTPSRDARLRCSGTIRHRETKAKLCHDLPEKSRRKLAPVRFAVACDRGHIMDFPWKEWAHAGVDCGAPPGHLFFLTGGGGAGLDGIHIQCEKCGKWRSMRSAFSKSAFDDIWGGKCPGHRPWLGPSGTVSCDRPPKTVQRGASNVYFAKMVTSILIPPYSERLRLVLDQPLIWSMIEALPLVDGRLPRGPLDVIADNNGIERELLADAVKKKLSSPPESIDTAPSEEEYRAVEYAAFTGMRPPIEERAEFDIEPHAIEQYAPWFREYFDRVVLVTKLRETRALVGFSRLVPPDAETETAVENSDLSLAPRDWLPAMEVKGEGIFLILRDEAAKDWTAGRGFWRARRSAVGNRAERMRSCLTAYRAERKVSGHGVSPEFIALHTLAHLLIRQLSFDCGYSAASLRERLYVRDIGSTPMLGLLIYTASGDSEGSMGGLVRLGLPGLLENCVRASLINARICSSDPLCIESRGQGIGTLNLAACHACTLLPETSCEEGNKLLDRVALVGSSDDAALGFFGQLVNG